MPTLTFTEVLKMNVIYCATCKTPFAISDNHQEKLRQTHECFHCPNGHSNVYSGDNTEEKLRAELRRKEQELADTSIEKIKLRNEIIEKDRKLKRLTNGVCPCCNRSFANLANHMKKQHPEQVSKKR